MFTLNRLVSLLVGMWDNSKYKVSLTVTFGAMLRIGLNL